MALVQCRECGKEISSAATAFPHCGAPPTKVNPPQPAPSKALVGCLGSIFGIIGLAVVIGLFGWMVSPSGEEKKRQDTIDAIAKYEKLCSDSQAAYLVSRQFVERILKAPSTAQFPALSEVNVRYLGDCKHAIDGFVDAQNSFGAQIRTRYHAEVQNQKGSDSWKALDVRPVDK